MAYTKVLVSLLVIIIFVCATARARGCSSAPALTVAHSSGGRAARALDDAHRRGQADMTAMLRAFHDICVSLNIEYCAVGGVLIGAVRTGGWIPWDGDVDVIMLDEDFSKFCDKRALLPRWTFLQLASEDPYYPDHKISKIRHKYARYAWDDPRRWHHGLQIDIWRARPGTDGTYFLMTDDGSRFARETDRTLRLRLGAFPATTIPFEGAPIFVPANYRDFLTETYGRCPPPLPPERERTCHEGPIAYDVPEVWRAVMYPRVYAESP